MAVKEVVDLLPVCVAGNGFKGPFIPHKLHPQSTLYFHFGSKSSCYSEENEFPDRPDQNCASMLNVKFIANAGGDVVYDICNVRKCSNVPNGISWLIFNGYFVSKGSIPVIENSEVLLPPNPLSRIFAKFYLQRTCKPDECFVFLFGSHKQLNSQFHCILMDDRPLTFGNFKIWTTFRLSLT